MWVTKKLPGILNGNPAINTAERSQRSWRERICNGISRLNSVSKEGVHWTTLHIACHIPLVRSAYGSLRNRLQNKNSFKKYGRVFLCVSFAPFKELYLWFENTKYLQYCKIYYRFRWDNSPFRAFPRDTLSRQCRYQDTQTALLTCLHKSRRNMSLWRQSLDSWQFIRVKMSTSIDHVTLLFDNIY